MKSVAAGEEVSTHYSSRQGFNGHNFHQVLLGTHFYDATAHRPVSKLLFYAGSCTGKLSAFFIVRFCKTQRAKLKPFFKTQGSKLKVFPENSMYRRFFNQILGKKNLLFLANFVCET